MRYYVIEALTPIEGEEERTILGFDSLNLAINKTKAKENDIWLNLNICQN